MRCAHAHSLSARAASVVIVTIRTVGSLTDAELRDVFDSGSLSRGKPYARAGRVTVREIDDDGARVVADVRGAGAEVYSTTVQVRVSPLGSLRVIASCSCPVSYACKHAVALVVAVRDSIEPYEEPSPDPTPVAPAAPSAPWKPSPVVHQPEWKATLGPLAASGSSPRGVVEWGLQLDVLGGSGYGVTLVSVRPLRRGAKGRWIKTGATWSDVDGVAMRGRGGAQAAALHDLHTSFRRTTHHGYGRHDGSIDLATMSAEGWTALERALEAGVS
ncbi:MAG: helicase, partial [Aeromicrobium sp.]|nr:helicase [Aeromicrobium sp.]